METLTTIIIKVVPKSYSLNFILDGVDDCTEKETRQLYQQLNILQSSIKMNVCTATGVEHQSSPTESQLSKNLSFVQILSIPEQNPDIATFIDLELARCIQSGDLVLEDGTLILDIRDALLRGAQGMILWVALQIVAICAEKTDDHIRQALRKLPRPLSEVFARELQRSQSRSTVEYRDRAVILLLGSVRPLSLEEFSEAISVEPGNINWQPAKHIDDVRAALNVLGRLVLIEEETSMVRISHHSIQKWLLSAYIHTDGQGFDDYFVHSKMAEIIKTYLSYRIFDRQLSTKVIPHISTRHVAPTVIATAFKSQQAANLALKLLRLGRTPDLDIGAAMAKMRNEAAVTITETFSFRHYAEQYFLDYEWTYLANEDDQELDKILAIVSRVNPKIWQIIKECQDSIRKDGYTFSLRNFYWASQEGTAFLLVLYTDSASKAALLWFIRDIELLQCLEWATTKTDLKLLKHLTERYLGCVWTGSAPHLVAALSYALRNSFFMAAKFLMDGYAHEGIDAESVLLHLARKGFVKAVEWLLNYGLSPNVLYKHASGNVGNSDGGLPWGAVLGPTYRDKSYPLLFFAVLSESAAMVRLCLRRGSLESGLKINVHDTTDLKRIFSFLVRNEFLTLYRQLFFENVDLLRDAPWYGRFVGRRAKALESSTSDEEGYLSYQRGDIIEISGPTSTPCWVGKIGESIGRFMTGTVEPITEVRAIYDFTATERDELSFKHGDTIVVEDTIHEAWWRGSLNGEVGLFPAQYVETITLVLDADEVNIEQPERCK